MACVILEDAVGLPYDRIIQSPFFLHSFGPEPSMVSVHGSF